jgi:hypothetical protein
MTYDWNANDHQSASGSKGFLDHADTLLLDLHLDRKATVRDPIHHSRSNVKLMLIQNRLNVPIIFIASCFGGLLLAKVLCALPTFSDIFTLWQLRISFPFLLANVMSC